MEQPFFLFIPVRIPESLIQETELVQKPTIAIIKEFQCCSRGLTCPTLEKQSFGHRKISP